METEPRLEHPTHGLAHANVVLAALALLTETPCNGDISASEPFKVNAPADRMALLEAVTAIQTEVSLSIYASDPLLVQASEDFAASRVGFLADEPVERFVDATDLIIQRWVSMLAGRGPALNEAAEWIIERGEVSLDEFADRVGITVPTPLL